MDKLIQESQCYKQIIREYCDLASRTSLTDSEADRIEDILEQAQTQPLLSFLLDEADHVMGHALDIITDEFIQTQQYQLRATIIAKQLKPIQDEDLAKSLCKAQSQLNQEGLYNGQIDGVFGPETQSAFGKLRRKLQSDLEKQGLHISTLNESDQIIQTLRQQGNHKEAEKVELLSLEGWFSYSC